jgi:hypothetical protein
MKRTTDQRPYKVICRWCWGWGLLVSDHNNNKAHTCSRCTGTGVSPIPMVELEQ